VSTPTLSAKASGTRWVLGAVLHWQNPLIVLMVSVLVLLVSYWQTITETVAQWQGNSAYQFAWIVIPTLLYLLWHNRNQFKQHPATGSLLGIPAAALCAGLWMAGDLVDIALLRQMALVLGVIAIVLAATGVRLFVALLPTMSVLFFLVPLGDLLLGPLKSALINFIEVFTTLTGLPYTRDGFTFFIDAHDYKVLDECSGLPYFLAGLFLGLTFALMIYRSWWKIFALTVFGGAIGVIQNFLRVGGIVVYDRLTGHQLTVPEHVYLELPAVLLCFGLLFFVFSRLSREKTLLDATAVTTELPSQTVVTSKGAVAIVAALAILVAAPLLSRIEPAATEHTAQQIQLPPGIGEWRVQAIAPSWNPAISGIEINQSGAVYSSGDASIEVYVAQALSDSAKISGGAVSMAGADEWMLASTTVEQLCLENHCIDVLKYSLRPHDGARVRYVYSAYLLGGDIFTSVLELRTQRAWNRWRGRNALPRLAAVMHDGDQTTDPAELARILLTSLGAE